MLARTGRYRRLWLAAALFLPFAAGTALAQTPADYIAASERFTGKVAAEQTMPRQSEPETRALLDALSDRRVLDAHEYSLEELPVLLEVCQRATQAMMAYALADVKQRIGAEREPVRAAIIMREQMTANMIQYQDEIATLTPFVIQCGARQLPLMAQFAQRLKPEEFTPVRRQGLDQARRGNWQMYLGLLTASDEIRLDNRDRMLRAGAEAAPAYAAAITPQERMELRMLAGKLVTTAPDLLRPSVESIAEAMSVTECTGLCAL